MEFHIDSCQISYGIYTVKIFLSRLGVPVLAMPRIAKRIVAVVVDAGLCVLTVWLAYYLRLGEFVILTGNAMWAAGISILIALPIFIILGLYRAIFRYSGWPALLAVAKAVAIYSLLYFYYLWGLLAHLHVFGWVRSMTTF